MEPNKLDILLGRSNASLRHTGNVCLRMLLLNHCVFTYKMMPTLTVKSGFIKAILHTIHAHGGRFLVKDKKTGEWKEVDDLQAKDKIGHMIRELGGSGSPKDSSLFLDRFCFPFSSFKSEYDFDWKVMVTKTDEHQEEQMKRRRVSTSVASTTTRNKVMGGDTAHHATPTSHPFDPFQQIEEGIDCNRIFFDSNIPATKNYPQEKDDMLVGNQVFADNGNAATVPPPFTFEQTPDTTATTATIIADWALLFARNSERESLQYLDMKDDELAWEPLHRSTSNYSFSSI